MRAMFNGATAFNQDLSNWDIGAVTNMTDMFTGVTLSTANYDSMLDSWSKQAVQSNVTFSGGNSKYCDLGEAGKAILVGKGWTITDGGKDTSGSCDAFITVWETTTAGESITIPTATDATYDYTIDWGDGSAVESGQTGNATHSYATAGEYDVSITGTFPRIYFNNTGDKTKILEVKQWGSQPWTSMDSAFYGCRNLNITAADVPDLTTVSSMESMFNDTNLSIANNINDWDVSNVTNMTSMFSSSSFGQAIGNWDTSNVTSMGSMFNDATAFNQDLSSWDTSSVTVMQYMFYGATSFNQNISGWDTSKVTTMEGLFFDATAFNQDISGWDTSAVTNMYAIFNQATVFNQDLSSWDTSNVTTMRAMFNGATAFNQDLSNWDIGAVTNMTNMFTGVTLSTANYDSILDSWSKQVVQSNVTFSGGNSKYCDLGEAGKAILVGKGWTITDGGKDTSGSCDAFITVWETTTAGESITIPTATDATYDYTIDWGDGSAVESGQTGNATHSYATAGEYDVSITGTFPRIYFNNTGDKTKILEVKQWGSQPWTSMEGAFYGCNSLNITANADVPDLTTVSSMESMFNDTNLSIANNINDWDVSNVTNMTSMFSSSSFGQAIGNWDTSNVTSMGSMFNDATAFNQDLSSWNTSSCYLIMAVYVFWRNCPLTKTSADGIPVRLPPWKYVFHATAFNQDISGWDTSSVTNMSLCLTSNCL